MHPRATRPLAATTPSELLTALGTGDRVTGYEAVLDAILDRLDGAPSTACVGTVRSVGDHLVPSVVVIVEDQIIEGWLTGNTVSTATTPRPGRPG